MLPHLHFLLFIFLFPTLGQQQQQAPPPPSGNGDDVRSLLEFRKGIQSDASGRVFNTWAQPLALGSDGCPGSWHGVTCDGGAVVAVALDGLGLSGELKFSTLIGMRSLRSLSLSGNSLTGRLVPVVGSMASLQHLDLSGNRFYGPIPKRITELWGLVHLNLSFNGFEGGFPSGIQNLQQLRVLDLRSNRLWGDVGAILSELRNVEHVDLSGNEFYGGLAMDPGNVSGMANTVKYVNLSYNKLSGGFFSGDSLKLFRNLEVLDVGQNQLGWELPSFDALSNLRVLRAGNNQLYGSLPEELFKSSMPLVELDLSGNGFTGSVFSINSTSLKVLNLSSNALSGSLLSDVGSCSIMDLSENSISGDLTAMQNWGGTLEVIDLSSNTLSGNFPNLTSQFGVLTSIKMRNNSIVGILPPMLGNYGRLSTVDLSMNKMSGSLLPGLLTSSTLTYLNLSKNHFTGTLPLQNPQYTKSLVLPSIPPMESLDLSDNSLSGSLPPEIDKMQRLKLLDLGKNSLSGEIPSEISKLDALEFLDLTMNQFKGKIPDMPQTSLKLFNVSYNDLSGLIPGNLRRFPDASFHPGNALLVFPDGSSTQVIGPRVINNDGQNHPLKSRIRIAFIVGSVGAVVLIFFIIMAVYKIRSLELCGRNKFIGQATGDVKLGRFVPPNIFRSHKNGTVPNSVSFSNDHLLTSAARSMPVQKEIITASVECGFSDSREVGSESRKFGVLDDCSSAGGWRSSPGSPLSLSPHLIDAHITEQPVVLDVYSPDRLAGELFFLDNSLVFTAEDLSRAPAEVLGRSSHGTSYKATLDTGHMLTVKWLRVGLVKRKKEFAKEAKRIGAIRHPNIVSLRGYYWGPREQERLILADYVHGDSLALHLYESTPRRYSPLSFTQRLKIAVDVARCLYYLHHDRGLSHGNLQPTNILLTGPDLTAQLADYGLHRLVTLKGTAEQMLNLGALGYRAPELATAGKPFPTFKADVFAFGVIMMEMLTGRSAGDIISGQSGAVDLTDWVRVCVREGRGTDCFDRDIAGLEEAPRAMDELLAISLRCTLPVNDRPNIRAIFEDLCSIRI